MWKIKESKHEDKLLDFIELSDGNLTGRIYPNLGGSLQELILDKIEIIDGIRPDETGIEDYQNTYKSSVLFPFPNRVKDGTYAFGESTYQLSINDLAFNNAIHGLVHNREFSHSVKENGPDKAILEMKHSATRSDPGFPFPYDLTLTYTFEKDGCIRLDFDVTNTGYQTFPFGLGWHPYFISSNLGESRIESSFKDHYLCPERMIPEEKEESDLGSGFSIGDRRFDDGFSLEAAECVFETPDYSLRMRFDSVSDPFLQIYTPEHRNSIAIEPMTCLTNALNNGIGLEALDPGESFRWSIEMRVEIKS